MHPSAFDDAHRFVDQYLATRESLRIADVGSFDLNGSLKPLFDRPGWTYVGLDPAPGPNVDVVLPGEDAWPDIATGAFDVVVSSQRLDHVTRPWRWMAELSRICAPGGLIYVCAPNTWGHNDYPLDCWRVWPDGLRALFTDTQIIPCEIYAAGPDTTGIGRRMTEQQAQAARRVPRLTLLCLTTGRPTLCETLNALKQQVRNDLDEVLLVNDGVATEFVRNAWAESHLPGRLIELPEGPHGDWGHTPRNRILPQATGDYVVHLDDDDICAPLGLVAIRTAIQSAPGSLFLFRMVYPDGRTFWNDHEVRMGNVGTGIFVHPTGIPLGRFGPTHEGDYGFVSETIQLNPDRLVQWRDEVIALIRPHTTWSNPAFVDLAQQSGGAGRYDCQRGWHHYFGRYFQNQKILDVGAGTGLSKPRLAVGNNHVELQDLAPSMPVDWDCDVTQIPSQSFDVVTSFDVMEHVPETLSFLRELVRIAKSAIVLTTPNAWISHCGNPFHVREYTPPQLLHLISQLPRVKSVDWYTSTEPDGSSPYPRANGQFLVSKAPLLGMVIHLDRNETV